MKKLILFLFLIYLSFSGLAQVEIQAPNIMGDRFATSGISDGEQLHLKGGFWSWMKISNSSGSGTIGFLPSNTTSMAIKNNNQGLEIL